MSQAWQAFGAAFRVEASGPLQAHFARLFVGLPPADHAAAAPLTVKPPTNAGDEVAEFVGDMNVWAMAAVEGSLLLHAGAVCRSDGDVLVVCGPSGSGKTTLTAQLTARGHSYLTDETACIDPHSLDVMPFRKPISVKPGAQGILGYLRPGPEDLPFIGSQWLVPPDRLGGMPVPSTRLRLGMIVFPTYLPGEPLSVQALTPARAAYEMGRNSSRLRELRGGALDGLLRVARRTPAYQIVHGDEDAAVQWALEAWAQR